MRAPVLGGWGLISGRALMITAPLNLVTLKRLAPQLSDLANAHGGGALQAFPSAERRIAMQVSDVDLLVVFSRSPSFE